MFTKRTIIGTVIGGGIVAIGVAAFVMSIGLQTVSIDDTYVAGDSGAYKFSAPAHSQHEIRITGDSFDVELSSPADGLQVQSVSHKKEAFYEWAHQADGESRLHVQNTGQSDIILAGSAQIATDPIYYTYHVLVMISGIVIIGFSAGFSVRKPRGF